jgi:hypothetical protein
LTPRIAAAPDLLCALDLSGPENDGPTSVTACPWRPSRTELRRYLRRPANRHQHGLRGPMVGLPAVFAHATARVRGIGATLATGLSRHRR